MSRRASTPLQRAADVIASPREFGPARLAARAVLTAALDDPDLAPMISTWRRPCGHSRLVNVRGELAGSGGTGFEDACSPCVRDRMRTYFLGDS